MPLSTTSHTVRSAVHHLQDKEWIEMNGMILGAYEQAWRRSGSPDWPEEFAPDTAREADDSGSSPTWRAGNVIGFAAMVVALFFAGASYA
jgi:hypothetical protein